MGKCEVVKTNHNLDTQYITSEIQIWQENLIKIRALDNTTCSRADMENKGDYKLLLSSSTNDVCTEWCMGNMNKKKLMTFKWDQICNQFKDINIKTKIVMLKDIMKYKI